MWIHLVRVQVTESNLRKNTAWCRGQMWLRLQLTVPVLMIAVENIKQDITRSYRMAENFQVWLVETVTVHPGGSVGNLEDGGFESRRSHTTWDSLSHRALYNRERLFTS